MASITASNSVRSRSASMRTGSSGTSAPRLAAAVVGLHQHADGIAAGVRAV
jgi:hypothetical protein